jgi:hypothetical protein
MKMFSRILSLVIIASLCLFYVGCNKNDGGGDPLAKQQLAKLEKKTWTINSVSFTGTGAVEDRKSDFAGATLAFSGTYSSDTNTQYPYTWTGTMPAANSPWPRTGHIKFPTSAPDKQFIRYEDATVISYVVSDSQLTLIFDFSGDGYAPGRTSEVSGHWVFTFN